jgi:hypothetical protein
MSTISQEGSPQDNEKIEEKLDLMPASEVLKTQLEQAYIRINEDIKQMSTIRNWCVTVWIAIITVSNSAGLNLTTLQKVILPILPIFLFWLIEGVQRVFARLHVQLAQNLEIALAEGVLNRAIIKDYLFLTSEARFNTRQKLKVLTHILFTSEILATFYGLLLGLTLLIQWLLRL